MNVGDGLPVFIQLIQPTQLNDLQELGNYLHQKLIAISKPPNPKQRSHS
jgi:hypothetical protein